MHMQRTLIGVIGPGEDASPADEADAFAVGALIARSGWTLVTGGRAAGVMHAASRGTQSAGGLVVGILPGADAEDASPAVDIPVVTGLGEARNAVLVLSCQAVVVCGMNPGTASEVVLAIKAERPIVLLRPAPDTLAFFRKLAGSKLLVAEGLAQAIDLLTRALSDTAEAQRG